MLSPETKAQSHLSYQDLQQRLQAAEADLQKCRSLAAAGRFAGAVMHEVNNPLEALSNLIYLAKIHPAASYELISYLELAEAQLKIIGSVTRKTLSYFQQHAMSSECDIGEIAASALQIHATRIRKQKIEVCEQIDGPATSRVVAGEILQVISNLILNAMDALPPEGAVLSIRVKPRGRHVIVLVADNGCGIDQAVMKTLFQCNQTSKKEGTGFGLWLSNEIVGRCGGQILVRTCVKQERSGTSFCLRLPRYDC